MEGIYMKQTEDGIIQIPVREFDEIFDDLRTVQYGNIHYAAGREDALEAFHHRIYESAEIAIE